MRNVLLTAEEATLVFTALNQGNPQTGLSIPEIRAVLPILDALEARAQKHIMPNNTGETLLFVDTPLQLKEAEYSLLLQKLENSSGWKSADVGRRVIKLTERLKEIPNTNIQAEG